MDTINAAKFKATCLALLDQVERTGELVRITKRGKPVAQLAPLSRAGKRAILGCMEGTAKIVGDIADRFIAATAQVRGFTLITSDAHLLECTSLRTLSNR